MTMKRQLPEEWLSAYVDGELTAAEQAEVESALRDNADYRQQVDDYRQLREQLQRIPRASLDDDFAARVLQAAVRAKAGLTETRSDNRVTEGPPAQQASPAEASRVDLSLLMQQQARALRRWRIAFSMASTLAALLLIALAGQGVLPLGRHTARAWKSSDAADSTHSLEGRDRQGVEHWRYGTAEGYAIPAPMGAATEFSAGPEDGRRAGGSGAFGGQEDGVGLGGMPGGLGGMPGGPLGGGLGGAGGMPAGGMPAGAIPLPAVEEKAETLRRKATPSESDQVFDAPAPARDLRFMTPPAASPGAPKGGAPAPPAPAPADKPAAASDKVDELRSYNTPMPATGRGASAPSRGAPAPSRGVPAPDAVRAKTEGVPSDPRELKMPPELPEELKRQFALGIEPQQEWRKQLKQAEGDGRACLMLNVLLEAQSDGGAGDGVGRLADALDRSKWQIQEGRADGEKPEVGKKAESEWREAQSERLAIRLRSLGREASLSAEKLSAEKLAAPTLAKGNQSDRNRSTEAEPAIELSEAGDVAQLLWFTTPRDVEMLVQRLSEAESVEVQAQVVRWDVEGTNLLPTVNFSQARGANPVFYSYLPAEAALSQTEKALSENGVVPQAPEQVAKAKRYSDFSRRIPIPYAEDGTKPAAKPPLPVPGEGAAAATAAEDADATTAKDAVADPGALRDDVWLPVLLTVEMVRPAAPLEVGKPASPPKPAEAPPP